MKRILFFSAMMFLVSIVSAQFIYNDFDANQNIPFTGGNPDPTIVANPYPGGINTSANVAEWIRGGWEWSHAKATVEGFIDFTTGTTFTLKVYSPISTTVKFKLEGIIGPVEVDQPVTAGSWQELSFDFPSAPNDSYNSIVIFFDPGTFGSDTYYFDDVEGPNYSTVEPKPYLAANVQDNFENDGWGTIPEWFFQDPDMDPLVTTEDPEDASNTVVDYNRSGTFQWTNAQAVLDHIMDLSDRNIFEMDVYFPSSNDYSGDLANTVALKLQNSLMGGNAWQTQTEIVHTIDSYDQWVTVSFDFSAIADSANYDQIVVQLGGEGHWVPAQFYFDNIELLLPVYPEPEYIYNDFDDNQNNEISGDPVMPVIVANPDVSGINTSANCAEYLKSQEDWAYVYTELDELINFENGTNFQLKVHSAIIADVTFKLENRYASWISTEKTATIPNTDEWVLLNFDFPDAPSETYSKIVIFFGFSETMGETFYFDDLTGPVYDTPKLYMEEDVQDNFEDDGWGTLDGWLFQDPDMNPLTTTTDPEDPDNTVADYNRSGAFMYTNAQVETDHRLDLTERNKFQLAVYFPSSNDYTGDLAPTAAIKLQNSLYIENAWWTQEEIVHTITNFDVWDTLVFDFGYASDRTDFDQIVIQLGGEGHNVPAQFYFDNLYLKHVPYVTVQSPNGGEEIEQNSSYMISWDHNYWDGDIDIEVTKGDDAPEPLAIGLAASDSTWEWIVPFDQEPGEDYKVIITYQEDNTITDTSDMYFTILEVDGVSANFSGEPTLIEAGGSVTYTDLSAGDPDTWEWYFEGGTPETYDGQNPPEIFYETAGTYDVSLLVYSGNDSDETLKEDYIEVTPPAELMPPANLQAVIDDNDDVQLSWEAPGTSELIYDNDVITGAYSYEGYTMSTHMSPEGSCQVLALKFYTTTDPGDNTFNANLYNWEDSAPGTDVVYSEVATAMEEMWVMVDVSGQDINFSGDFVVGFGSINATTFLGYDGDLDNGRSWDFDNDASWEQWNEAYLIRAVVQYEDGKIAEIGNTTSQISNRSTGKSAHGTDYSNLKFADPISNQNKQLSNLLGYNVYRNDEQINEDLVVATDFTDPMPGIGSYDYHVTAMYDSGESGPSNMASIVITGIDEITAVSFDVYPNPTTGLFTIANNEQLIIELSVIDLRGKEVYRETLNKTSSINLSYVQKGIYFLRLLDKSSNNLVIKKLVVR